MIKLPKDIIYAKSVYCQDNLQKFRSGALLHRLAGSAVRSFNRASGVYAKKAHPESEKLSGCVFL